MIFRAWFYFLLFPVLISTFYEPLCQSVCKGGDHNLQGRSSLRLLNVDKGFYGRIGGLAIALLGHPKSMVLGVSEVMFRFTYLGGRNIKANNSIPFTAVLNYVV